MNGTDKDLHQDETSREAYQQTPINQTDVKNEPMMSSAGAENSDRRRSSGLTSASATSSMAPTSVNRTQGGPLKVEGGSSFSISEGADSRDVDMDAPQNQGGLAGKRGSGSSAASGSGSGSGSRDVGGNGSGSAGEMNVSLVVFFLHWFGAFFFRWGSSVWEDDREDV